MSFKGWPAEAFEFYEELEANNRRAWWQAHRDVYDSIVKAPFGELGVAVADEFGPLHLFRPNRDVRFSKDKSPYKTAAAAMTESEGGSAYYVQLSSEGLMVGAGMYHFERDQLERFRQALLDDKPGGRIVGITDELTRQRYEVTASSTLKTAPRGWHRDHPRIALARLKGLVIAKTFPRARWQATAAALGRIVGVWRDAAPMITWLDEVVGPSTIPPREFG